MKKRRNIYYTFALLFLAFMMMGNRPDCDTREPNLTCTDLSITLSPGECVDITNPCNASGDFDRIDGFRICDAPDGIFVRTNRSRSGSTRQICAAIYVAPMTNEPASFIYATPGKFGEGVITITTNPALSVAVFASPTSVVAGDPVDLTSVVSGGTAPYTYAWASNPSGQINPADTVLANPTVNPTVSTTYTLVVVDDDGDTAIDSVSIAVGMAVVVSPYANINVGGSAQLTASASGGDGNFTYSWTPAGGLDDANIANPLASPSITTTYTVTVNDGSGGSATGQVTVNVQLEAVASATPDTIDAGNSSTLDVTAAGGDGNYSFLWTAADGLNPADANSQSPEVTPSATTTYTVTVTDGNGDSASSDVIVTVNAAPGGPTPCWTNNPFVPFTDIIFDMSCSTPSAGETIDCISWHIESAFPGEPLSTALVWPQPLGTCGDPATIGSTVTYFFAEGNQVRVTLTVRDTSGITNTLVADY